MKLSTDVINFFEVYFDELIKTISKEEIQKLQKCPSLTWGNMEGITMFINHKEYFSLNFYSDRIYVIFKNKVTQLDKSIRDKITTGVGEESYINQSLIGNIMIKKLKELFNTTMA